MAGHPHITNKMKAIPTRVIVLVSRHLAATNTTRTCFQDSRGAATGEARRH